MVSIPVRFFFALSRTPYHFRGIVRGTEYSLVKGKNAKAKSRKEGSMYAEKVFSSLPIIHNNQKFASIPQVFLCMMGWSAVRRTICAIDGGGECRM